VRIAHTCASCGFDLSRTPAPIDPHYALPIVICPTCRAAVVRREHPTMSWSRWAGRALFSLLSLLIRAGATLAIAAVVISMSDALWPEVRRGFADSSRSREVIAVMIITWLLAACISGFWTGLLFTHWSFRRLAIAWLTFLLLLPFAYSTLAFLDRLNSIPHDAAFFTSGFFRNAINQFRRSLTGSFPLIFAAWAVSLVAMPLGRAASSRWRQQRRRAVWRRIRATRKATCTSKLLTRA